MYHYYRSHQSSTILLQRRWPWPLCLPPIISMILQAQPGRVLSSGGNIGWAISARRRGKHCLGAGFQEVLQSRLRACNIMLVRVGNK